jgi:hypothetical protein
MMRYLLVEAAQTASRLDPELWRTITTIEVSSWQCGGESCHRTKIAVRLYWKLREAEQPVPSARMQGSPAGPVVGESLSPY